MVKNDLRIFLLTFFGGTVLFLILVSKFFSDNKGIDLEFIMKTDRDFYMEIFYNDNDTPIRIGVNKSNSYKSVKIDLDTDKLEKLRVNFGIRNNIYINKLKIIGKRKNIIPLEIIESSERENIEIFEKYKKYVQISSSQNDPTIILNDKFIENQKYTRRNFMDLLALYLIIFFAGLAMISRISNKMISSTENYSLSESLTN